MRAIGLGAYTDSGSWWPILVQVALGAAAFATLLLATAARPRNFSVLVTGVLAATTIPSAWWRTGTVPPPTNESAFWTPLTFALNLIVGNVRRATSARMRQPYHWRCNSAAAGPLLLVVAALGIWPQLFGQQNDRILVRFGGSLVVLVGLTDEAMPLMRRLSTNASRHHTRCSGRGSRQSLIKTARGLGATGRRLVDLDQSWGLRCTAHRAREVQGAGASTPSPPMLRRTCAGQRNCVRSRTPASRSRADRRRGWLSVSTIHGRPSTGAGPTRTGHRVRALRSAG